MYRLTKKQLPLLLTIFSFMVILVIPYTVYSAEMTLAWVKPNDNSVVGYKIYCGKSGTDFKSTPVQTINSADQTSCLVSGLEEGQIYAFAATSFDSSGNQSTFSNTFYYSVPVTNLDTDNDGLTDDQEVNTYGTDPAVADTDGDGITDGQEVAYWGNNWKADIDNDGLINLLDPDSDNDGVKDGTEISQGTNPADPNDNGSVTPVTIHEIIVDNGGAGTSSTGTWKNSAGVNYYDSKSVFSQTPGDTYTYEAAINGTCEISLWWTEHSTRGTNIPVEIYDGSQLLDTVYVNQTANGGQWNLEGTYTFSGTARVVILSESNSYSTSADAVKFACSEMVVDNGGNGTSFTGTWSESAGALYYDSVSVFSQTIGDTYTYEAPINGTCKVALWWTEYSTRSTNIPVEIYDGSQLLDTVYVDQTTNGGQWNLEGIYTFTGNAKIVILSESDSSSTCADAVQFTGTEAGNSSANKDGALDTSSEVIIDNGGTGTSHTGRWKHSAGKDYYDSRSVYSQTSGNTYIYEAAVDGTCEISLWWTEYSSRSTNVPVEIYDGNQLLDTVYVDQKANGGQWNIQGTYTFSGTARVVILSDSNSSSTCADAVRFAGPQSVFAALN